MHTIYVLLFLVECMLGIIGINAINNRQSTISLLSGLSFVAILIVVYHLKYCLHYV